MLVILFVGLYVFLPCVVLYVTISFAYPIICLAVTPWASVQLLQLVLTGGYGVLCIVLILLAPRVHRFQHANYNLIAPRRSFWDLQGEQGMTEIRKEYITLIMTNHRDRVIKQFFGDLTPIFMQFLPELMDLEEMDWMNQNKWYLEDEPTFDDRLFNVADIRTHRKFHKELDVLEEHEEFLRNATITPIWRKAW